MSEKCTIIVVVRDRFSTTTHCLDAILKNTPEPHEIVAVLGGVPDSLQNKWTGLYGGKVRFLFGPHLLNPSQSRNTGLREAKTRLAVLLDNDVYVRPSWLTPLIERLNKTNSAMVVPLVLDEEEEVHTAGNDLFITYRNGEAFGCKELRFGGQAFFGTCNLKAKTTDYGELHCQLVDVQTALRLGVYDEKLREVAEVDSGLIWAKAGCTMFVEPQSVVHFDYPLRITRAEDIRPFIFKWDTAAIAESYAHFKTKWGMDITEGGKWKEFLVFLNSKLGFFPRLFPSPLGIALDSCYRNFRRFLDAPHRWYTAFKARRLGRGLWK
jgi:glycosyltransferase involved in cell wall biosynthesis